MQNSSGAKVKKTSAHESTRAIDRRTLRTRNKLSWSFVELAQRQGFDKTTVKDIVSHAKVGRSTFYAHFEDKDDMFIQHFVGFVESLGARLECTRETGAYRLPIQAFFEHVAAMRPLYMAMVTSHRLDPMLKVGRVALAASIEKRMRTLSPDKPANEMPVALFAQHMAATLLNLLTWWMDHHQPCTAAELDRYFHELIPAI